jgi:hypothetical protein
MSRVKQYETIGEPPWIEEVGAVEVCLIMRLKQHNRQERCLKR